MFKPVDTKLDVPALEREVIARWRERDTMARYLARNDGSERRFSFIDGPITANNPMGVHHAWGRTYKDLFQRYHSMLGERQRHQNGFDCQGLWIEVEVERELGFNNKRQIEEFGIDRFVELCKARVDKFAAIQTEQSKRLGYWMDWDHSYYTNSDENNYTIWAFLAECHRRGLLYKGHDVMPWCPRCATGISNMEAAEGYRNVGHLSATLRLPITSPGHEGEDLLVWTTTPWTLSSNVAAAVHPDLTYVLVEGGDGRQWWVSAGSKGRVAPNATVVREAIGSELVGLAYARSVRRAAGGDWDRAPSHRLERRLGRGGNRDRAHRSRLRPGGLRAGKENGLAVIDPIDQFGDLRRRTSDGRPVALRVRQPIPPRTWRAPSSLTCERKGLLVAQEQYPHRYPHCWRCGTSCVFRLVDEWFITHGPVARADQRASTRRSAGCRTVSASRRASWTGCGTWATG